MSRLTNSFQCKLNNFQYLFCKFGRTESKTFWNPLIECVRWYRPRKPFWLPTAKSKLFRIPRKADIPKYESDELSRLYNVYRTNMKSLQHYFKEQLQLQTTAPEVIEQRKLKEENQHAECLKLNDAWNTEVSKLREARLAKEAIEREERIRKKIIEDNEKQRQLIAKIDAHILKEKEESKYFITQENIDEAIETALTVMVDHNFCIDLEGNIYKGRYAKPSVKSFDENKRSLATKADKVDEDTTELKARG